MKVTLHLLVIACIFFQSVIPVHGQQLITESKTHIFWQPDRKLTPGDFQGEPRPADLTNCEEKGYCAVPCLGIFFEVDVHKNYRRNRLEKVYFSPAFQKSCSYRINDTKDMRDAQLLFDMAELSSRIGRKLLRDYHNYMAIKMDSINVTLIRENPDTILVTGVGSSLAWHARDSAWSFYQEMSASYLRHVYFEDEKDKYEDWRILVDELLEKYKIYATKPEECYRMVNERPIVKRFKKSFE